MGGGDGERESEGEADALRHSDGVVDADADPLGVEVGQPLGAPLAEALPQAVGEDVGVALSVWLVVPLAVEEAVLEDGSEGFEEPLEVAVFAAVREDVEVAQKDWLVVALDELVLTALGEALPLLECVALLLPVEEVVAERVVGSCVVVEVKLSVVEPEKLAEVHAVGEKEVVAQALIAPVEEARGEPVFDGDLEPEGDREDVWQEELQNEEVGEKVIEMELVSEPRGEGEKEADEAPVLDGVAVGVKGSQNE